MTRRIVSAMLSGEPETNDLPMRRLGQAIFASIMIGTIVLAVIGVIGVVTGNGSDLEENTLVVEKGNGATFVYIDEDGSAVLHPVVNYASARLILGEAEPKQRTMSHAALLGLTRGPALGILNAPDALPTPDALLGTPWTVCNVPGLSGGTGSARAVIGEPVTGGTPVGGDDSLFVQNGGDQYLIYNNLKMKITEPVATTALGFNAPPVRVTQQFLNAVPSGPRLAVPGVDGAGDDSNLSIGGVRSTIGWVYQDENQQYYLLTRSNLVRIGAPVARLRLARDNLDTTAPLRPHQISAAAAARYVAQNLTYEQASFPHTVPVLLNDPGGAPAVLCSRYEENAQGGTTTVSMLRSVPPALAAGLAVRQNATDVVSAVNQIIIAGGHGVLVQPQPAPGASPGGSAIYLVTDNGIKYPLARAASDRKDAVEALGYSGVTPVHVPLSMLDLLPTGVTLDANQARRPVVGFGTTRPASPKPSVTATPQPSSTPPTPTPPAGAPGRVGTAPSGSPKP